jgi:hypothetical protein
MLAEKFMLMLETLRTAAMRWFRPRQYKTGFGHDKTAHNHENMGFVPSSFTRLLLQLFEVTFTCQ